MRRTIQSLTTLTLTVGAFAIFTTTASADVAKDYQKDMNAFVPVLREWIAEIEQVADRALAKPGEACSADVVELGHRGAGMARDLEGTLAPAALEEAHADLIDAFFSIAESTANGCTLGAALADDIAGDVDTAKDALRAIGYFAQRAPGIAIELPVPPVTGNE